MGYVGECVRYEYSVTNAGNVTAPFLTAVPVGSTIVLGINAPAVSSITNFTVTDTKGNTWTQRQFAQNSILANGQGAMFTCTVTTALTTSDTATVTAVTRTPDRWDVLGLVFNDIATTSAYDTGASTAGGVGSALSVGPSATTAQADELVVAAYTATAAPTVTPGTGYTAQSVLTTSNATAPKSLIMMWKYVTATGAQTATATLNASQSWTGMMVTLKKAAAAPIYTRWLVNPTTGLWVPSTSVFI